MAALSTPRGQWQAERPVLPLRDVAQQAHRRRVVAPETLDALPTARVVRLQMWTKAPPVMHFTRITGKARRLKAWLRLGDGVPRRRRHT